MAAKPAGVDMARNYVTVISVCIENESVPNTIINGTIIFFLNCSIRLGNFKPSVSECCLIKLFPCILFEKYINISALVTVSPGNRNCANCIGALSFHVDVHTDYKHVARRTGGAA